MLMSFRCSHIHLVFDHRSVYLARVYRLSEDPSRACHNGRSYPGRKDDCRYRYYFPEGALLLCVLGDSYRVMSNTDAMKRAGNAVVLSMDIMDISGEHQLDLTHATTKNRLDKNGKVVGVIKDGRQYRSPSL